MQVQTVDGRTDTMMTEEEKARWMELVRKVRSVEELTEEEKNEYQKMITKFFPDKEGVREETSLDK